MTGANPAMMGGKMREGQAETAAGMSISGKVPAVIRAYGRSHRADDET